MSITATSGTAVQAQDQAEVDGTPTQAPTILRSIQFRDDRHYKAVTVIWPLVDDDSATGYEIKVRQAGKDS